VSGSISAYSGSSISDDGSGTFTFYGGPKIGTPYGAASFGEQRWPTSGFGPLIRWGNFNFITNHFYPSSDWMPDSGAFNCGNPQPPFDYPDFFPGGGAEHGTDQAFGLPIKNVNWGVIQMNAFIAAPTACKDGICFYGDNRSFEGYSDARESRISVLLNFVTGQGHIYAHESCRTSGLPSCLAPRPLRQVSDLSDPFYDQNYNNYVLLMSPVDSNGDVTMQFAFTGTNSFVPPNLGLACSITNSWVFHWNATTYKMEYQGTQSDRFPSREVYWYQGHANVASPIHTFETHAETGGLDALCDYAP
jgi:hypothetical protein